jgi:hypothetical protein
MNGVTPWKAVFLKESLYCLKQVCTFKGRKNFEFCNLLTAIPDILSETKFYETVFFNPCNYHFRYFRL